MSVVSHGSSYLDLGTFRKLWNNLPKSCCDRAFWSVLEDFCATFLSPDCPLYDGEYCSIPHTGRIEVANMKPLDADLVYKSNELRSLYNKFTLLDPCSLASLLNVTVDEVVSQLLLAVEGHWMAIEFVVCCNSCGCDVLTRDTVATYVFTSSYHMTNSFRCPICTDRTELHALSDVNVFFRLEKLHPIFRPMHHRHFVTDSAKKRCLETFFCPAGAGFSVKLHLPRGRYLLSAPFMESFVELDVEVSAESIHTRERYITRTIDLQHFSVAERVRRKQVSQQLQQSQQQQSGHNVSGAAPMYVKRASMCHVAAALGSVASHSRAQSSHRGSLYPVTLANTSSRPNPNGQRASQFVLPSAETQEEGSPPLTVLSLKHGKVILRIHNSSLYSGFLDLCIAFDIRVEFCAMRRPVQLTVPYFMHCLPRGLRSPFVRRCTPQPPSTTRTTGIYVRHIFDLPYEEFANPSTIAVLREVHRYSLEDHWGLLLSVDHGGTAFASSFLTITSAVASSVCFFQRVLVRLGERVALCMRCSVTEGPLYIAAYQGQYNDADNIRCSYPDVQYVGPTIYASERPPITPHRLAAREVREPEVGELATRNRFVACRPASTNQANMCRHPFGAWEDDEEKSDTEEYPFDTAPVTQVRFELRSVRRSCCMLLSDNMETDWSAGNSHVYGLPTINKSTRSSLATDWGVESPCSAVPAECNNTSNTYHACSRFDFPGNAATAADGDAGGAGSVCLHESYRDGSAEEILPHFLDFLCEHFQGTTIHLESHALILEMPLPVILAAVQLSTILGRACYSQGKTGLF